MSTDLEQTNSAWLRELTIELRMRDVSGAAIGDAVASAREFLADAGAPADEAFGPASDYAAALDLDPAPDASAELRRSVIGGLASLLGFFAVIPSTSAAIRGEELVISAATLVLAATALILLAAAPAYLRQVVRSRIWKVIAVVVGLFALQLLVSVLFGGVVVASIPALPVAVAGWMLLLGTALWAQLRPSLADPISEPLASGASMPRSRRLLDVFPIWLLVGMAGVFVAIDLLLAG